MISFNSQTSWCDKEVTYPLSTNCFSMGHVIGLYFTQKLCLDLCCDLKKLCTPETESTRLLDHKMKFEGEYLSSCSIVKQSANY